MAMCRLVERADAEFDLLVVWYSTPGYRGMLYSTNGNFRVAYDDRHGPPNDRFRLFHKHAVHTIDKAITELESM